MARVDFRITKAYPDKDDRGRPVLTYQVEESGQSGWRIFNTPINSQLARLLRPDLERDDEDEFGEFPEPPKFSGVGE